MCATNKLAGGKLARAGFEYNGQQQNIWTTAPYNTLIFNSGNLNDVLALFKERGPVLSGELSKATFVVANASYSELTWVQSIYGQMVSARSALV